MDPQRTIISRLDHRLRASSPAPLAVGFSGGGDSLALLLMVDDWAKAHGRSLLVLTVDHGLNPASAGWTAACRATAGRLGLPFTSLHWQGDKPATGLPAAARAARHAMLAEAARAAGARVILLGHTADDLREAAAMRAEGSSLPDAREWAPSPAWPEGRELFLLRPMLGVGRRDLRDWLAARGERWIDDPANDDVRFARARVRKSSPVAKRAGEGDHPEDGGGVCAVGSGMASVGRLKRQTPAPPPPPRSARSPSPAEPGRTDGLATAPSTPGRASGRRPSAPP